MSEKEFEGLFKQYHNGLCNYAYSIVKDMEEANDIVQDVFISFWNNRSRDSIQSIERYLIKAVKFKCIDYHRKATIVSKSVHELTYHASNEPFEDDDTPDEGIDIIDAVQIAVNNLPEKTREVFQMSKVDGLKYKDIAEQLNISIKTVENQMLRAFRHLREKFKDYDLYMMVILFNLLGLL